ncbi:DNA internalization-related competence protein ComEC/Rec2 [Halobacillus kuroshimensis]|uniref:DNA internalization-related competence protein ComEC/Rec2 n=1 Tax=Halobacillus kuroshimensis TaxID=302481 RepID=A0ABS3DZA6_9BACI|nr:DNA internalization-related competence protein ComEC/Rec2 [Halobacillus kuroshimensis]MBN8236696.1 DNA internalization-related competence protein ComEC/Rec2 [Halobacillus kuroshimensis]
MNACTGRWHLPVLAFASGGVLASLEGDAVYVFAVLITVVLYGYRNHLPQFFLLCILLATGFFYLAPQTPQTQMENSETWTGVIDSEVKETSYAVQFLMENADGIKRQVRILKSDPDERVPVFHHGSVCTASGVTGPFASARNPGAFDYAEYMYTQGVFAEMVVQDHSDTACEGRSRLSYLYEWRTHLLKKVQRQLDPESYSWVKALVFGEKDALPEDIVNWFQAYNLSHILAISGLHAGLLAGGVYVSLYRSGLATKRQARIFLFLFLPSYTILAGAAPSVIRACVMALIVLVFSMSNRRIPLSDVIAWTAGFLLVWNPDYLHQIGFQFSFLVTFSLILSAPVLKKASGLWQQTVIISLICLLAILPLQIHYFYEFQPLSLFVNVAVVPYFSFFVIPVSFLLFLAALLFSGPVTYGFSSIFSDFHQRVLSAVMKVGGLLDLPWVIGELAASAILVFMVLFVRMMFHWCREKRGKALFFGAACVGVLMVYTSLPYLSPKGTVTMLDVGQGDSFIIELPYRKGVWMIDAAGPPVYMEDKAATAETIIVPFLKSRGIHTVDTLLITHEDSDHDGSVPYLLQHHNVNRLVTSPYNPVQYKGVEQKRVEAGDLLKGGGLEMRVRHPAEDRGDANDNSLVVDFDLGGKKWMFTGDISAPVEKELLQGAVAVRADVLKAAHHGSNTSSSEQWLERVGAEVVWVSAGVDNRYGHPHEEVLERLMDQEAVILRTDQSGAVSYNFYGDDGTFSTFLPYNASRK